MAQGLFLRNTIPTLFGAIFKKEYPQIVQAQIDQAAHFDTKASSTVYASHA